MNYPTVTQIIYSVIPLEFEPEDKYLLKGKGVHKAIELYIKGTLDMDNLPQYFSEYLKDFVRIQKEINLEIESFEERRIDEKYKFSGQADVVCKIKNTRYVIDIKTGKSLCVQWKLQLAAYQYLFKTKKRAVLYWDNCWKFIEYNSLLDFPAFLNCLSLYNYRLKEDKTFNPKTINC